MFSETLRSVQKLEDIKFRELNKNSCFVIKANKSGFFRSSFPNKTTFPMQRRFCTVAKDESQKDEKVINPAEGGEVPPPTPRQLLVYAVHCGLPMFGFGLMDNTIMIQAGDMIDTTIGVRFGFSTLTAAAFGQVFSDASGVCFGGVVEAMAGKVGLPQHRITDLQMKKYLRVKYTQVLASCIGVIFGCLLGMCQLFLMDLKKAERLKAQANTRPLLTNLMNEGMDLIDCERLNIYILTPAEAKELSAGSNPTDLQNMMLWQAASPDKQDVIGREAAFRSFELVDVENFGYVGLEDVTKMMLKLGHGQGCGDECREEAKRIIRDELGDAQLNRNQIAFDGYHKILPKVLKAVHTNSRIRVGECPLMLETMMSGRCMNVPRVDTFVSENRNRYSESERSVMDRLHGYQTQSLLTCPIIKGGHAVGVLQLANKCKDSSASRREQESLEIDPEGFDVNDEKIARSICSHACSTIKQVGLTDE